MKYLVWAELCYNTSYHSAIRMSPFEVVFGKPPPSFPSYVPGFSDVEAVDYWLVSRDAVMRSVHANLQRAQSRMKTSADIHLKEVCFEVGQWCYIRLQPHRQISVSGNKFTKHSKSFYGPLQFVKKIGHVAYKLELPVHCKIHDVFHVSILKLCPNPEHVALLPLPSLAEDNQPVVSAVVGSRTIRRGSMDVVQLLVQWKGLPLEETSWKNMSVFVKLYPTFHLEDKVLLHREGNDTIIEEIQNKRSKRMKSAPAKLVDYVVVNK